ncbi:glycosyltransferase [Photorhabdus antumapuensis]|uniref:glycosyltransferase n=1 Tax=Photorhabdus antumapuensis TaxID=2862867 RepID=UPI001CED4F5C|nr:glycosyltransferase [Photorhabdus antumapuensis]MCA6221630.1 glycosyltransferase [Photorhabdus antumapuensis]
MHKIELRFEDVAYPFWIGSHCTEEISAHLAEMSASFLHIITDDTVNQLHAAPFVQRLTLKTKVPVWVWLIPEGEANKSLNTLDYLANQLLNADVDRKSVIVAMGGGGIGNIAGLLAALLFRGIFLVVGDGPQRHRLEETIAQHQLESQFTITGFIPNDQVATAIAACHVIVMPSEHEEFGGVSIEATAVGVPVAALTHPSYIVIYALGDSLPCRRDAS